MPHFRLETNIPRSNIPDSFPKELNQVVAKTLGKPEEVTVTTVVPDQLMVHGTEEGPCGQATLMSIGKLGEEENLKHSKAISDKIEEIGIPADRLYITFNDTKNYNVGVGGKTAKCFGN